MSEEEKEEGGFTVNDRRSANQSDDDAQALDEERKKEEAKANAAAAQEQAAQQAQAGGAGPENFEIDFSTFIMSLASSAFYHLGDVPDPMTGQKEENLPAVKQTVDILGMLQAKTKNNLTAEEAKLIEQIIYELQMKYVAKSK